MLHQVEHRIAKSKMPHTIAEKIILPVAFELVGTMKGKAAQHFEFVPLSDDLLENKCILLPSNFRSIFCNVHLRSKFTQCSLENLTSYKWIRDLFVQPTPLSFTLTGNKQN